MTPPTGPHPVETARAYRAAQVFVVGAVAADLLVMAWAWSTWLAIGRLERDEIQMLSVWAPVASLYGIGGRFAAMVPFVLMSLVATVAMFGGWLRVRELRPWVTRGALRQAALAEESAHPFLRHVDETGAIPHRTIALGVVLALLLAGTAAWVISQR